MYSQYPLTYSTMAPGNIVMQIRGEVKGGFPGVGRARSAVSSVLLNPLNWGPATSYRTKISNLHVFTFDVSIATSSALSPLTSS